MPKLTLSDLSNITGNEQSAITTINNNHALIEAAIENTLSRDGTSPNSMGADLDMNSNDIMNVASLEAVSIEANTIESDDFTQDGISITTMLLDWEGPWLVTTNYLIGDIVENDGSSFIALQAHTSTLNDEPGTGAAWETYWDLVAQRGDPGVGGFPVSSTDNAVVRFDGTLGSSFQNSVVTISDTGTIAPVVNDQGALGTATTAFSDLFLAEGGVVNWDNGDVTLSQVGNTVTLAGCDAFIHSGTNFQVNGPTSCGVEIGRTDGTSSTPFIDFHSGATAVDYDVRLIASGGTGALGAGLLTVNASAGVTLGTSTALTVGSIELGAASDTTITRTGAGSIAVEGNTIYRAGGTDVPVADGGSGRSTATEYAVICGGTTSTGAHQSIAGVGTSGHVLTSNGASALPTFQAASSSAVQVVASGAVTGVAQLDLVLGSADMYEIDLINWQPVTDSVQLYARFSQSGSFLSGAADYLWGYWRTAAVGDSSDSEIQIMETWGNATDELGSYVIRIYRPSAAAFRKTMSFWGSASNTSTAIAMSVGSGTLIANSNAIDGVRFLFSSGNIATGYYAQRAYTF